MSEDKVGIVPYSERHPDLEKEVKTHMSGIIIPPQNKKKYYRIPIPSFKDERERTEWETIEIDRCINGYDGLSPKMYYFLQYGTVITPKGGKTTPEFRTIQHEWFKKVEACNGTGRGIVCVKRRRIGASVLESFDALHDCSFNPHFKLGMNSKSERDTIILFNRVKLAYDNLPTFLRPKSSAGRSRLNMDFSYYVKDEKGNKIKKGLGSEIVGVAPTPNAYEGLMLNKLISDESGKIDCLLDLWTFAEPTLMQDTQRVGVPLFFGTAGDIDKDAKGLITLWKEHHVQNLDRFFFAGYNGLIVDEFGNDMIEDAVRWIVYQRHRKANTRGYKDFIQQYPITAEEAFMPSQRTGIGDVIQINAQMLSLDSNPPVTKTGFFEMDANNIIHFKPSRDGKVVIYEHPDVNLQRGYVAACLPAGEKVLTDSGLKNIEEIDFKDKLVSKDGEYVNIKELKNYEVDEPLYEITTQNTLRKTKFTGEHPIYISKNIKGYVSSDRVKREGLKYAYKKLNFDFVKVSDVTKTDWIKYPNVYKKEKQLDLGLWKPNKRPHLNIDCPLENDDFWWFVGIWLGDGHNVKEGVVISCNINEESHLTKLTNIIEKLFNRKPQLIIKNKNQSCVDVIFTSQQVANFLNTHFGKYAYGKTIPEWFKFSKKSFKRALVGGYIDSDGCVGKDKRRNNYNLEIVSVNHEMMEHLQDILFSLGVISSVSLLRKSQNSTICGVAVSQRETYRLRMGHYWLRELSSQGCPSIKLTDKHLERNTKNDMGCFFDENKDYIYFQITNIEKNNFNGIVYNFHCETSTYICRHITTHNCDPADNDDTQGTDDVSDLSLHILKKPHGTHPPKIVLEYLDRPTKLDEYYYQSALCSLYYNKAKLLVENNRYRMISDFQKMGYGYLLQPSPQSIHRITPNATANSIGVRMTEPVRKYMISLIEQYLDNYINHIPSVRLLEQIKQYGMKNTDMVYSFGLALMLLAEDRAPVISAEKAESMFDFSYQRQGSKIIRINK